MLVVWGLIGLRGFKNLGVPFGDPYKNVHRILGYNPKP